VADLSAFWRLTGAGWALVRADALVPREAEPLLPPSAKLAGRLLRLFAGAAARRGRPGERLARVLENQGPAGSGQAPEGGEIGHQLRAPSPGAGPRRRR
jgi:ubiquinone biosynthesis protein